MRAIPSLLLDKIQQAYQTIHGNAEPHLDIFIGREADYLTALERFFVITIQPGQTLNRIDIAAARPDAYHLPTELTIVYLVDDDAYVATTPMPVHPKSKWTIQEALGKGIDVSIEFEVYWVRRERAKENFEDPRKSRFSLVTVGEPWCFVTRPDGSLEGKQGSGSWTTLVAEGVTRIDAIGGWKGLRVPHDDQGLVLAYIKNGVVCYRNRATQEDLSIIWEAEREIAELPSPVENISIFRTNDYRIGFIVETTDDPPEVHWALTERCWSGMAVDDHYVTTSLYSTSLGVTPITYEVAQSPDHSVTTSLQSPVISVCPADTPITTVTGKSIAVGSTTISLVFNAPILGDGAGLESAFIVSGGWTVLSTAVGVSPEELVLVVDSPVEMVSSFNVAYSGGYGLRLNRGGSCRPIVDGFTIEVDVKQPETWNAESVLASLGETSLSVVYISYEDVYHGTAEQNHVVTSLFSTSLSVTYVPDDPGPIDP